MKMKTRAPDAPSPPKRAYRLGARAEAQQASVARILDAFVRRLAEDWFDEIRLEEIAAEAGVSVPTVVRHFGGKEGLLDAAVDRLGREIPQRRSRHEGDVASAVAAIVEDYEETGDLTIRVLAQEARYPALRKATDFGRADNRRLLGETFGAALAGLPTDQRERRLDALVAATDVYLWKIYRRDLGRDRAELEALMVSFVHAALAAPHTEDLS